MNQVRLHRSLRQGLCLCVHVKAEPLLESHGAKETRGIIHETPLVQHPDRAILQIATATAIVDQDAESPWVQADRQCINREISPMQILLDRAWLDNGKRRRLSIGFLSRGRDINPTAVAIVTTAVGKRSCTMICPPTSRASSWA